MDFNVKLLSVVMGTIDGLQYLSDFTLLETGHYNKGSLTGRLKIEKALPVGNTCRAFLSGTQLGNANNGNQNGTISEQRRIKKHGEKSDTR